MTIFFSKIVISRILFFLPVYGFETVILDLQVLGTRTKRVRDIFSQKLQVKLQNVMLNYSPKVNLCTPVQKVAILFLYSLHHV